MTGVLAVALLLLYPSATVTVSGDGSPDTALTAAPGDVALLPCYSVGNVTPTVTTWVKNGRGLISGGASAVIPIGPTPAVKRLTVLHDGSLNIREVRRGDEGTYLCASTLPGNNTFHARVQLQVVSGPENVSISIRPASALSNGTLFTTRGSSVSFNCSASSYPSQLLSWAFSGHFYSNTSLAASNGSWLDLKIENIQPSAQGVYTCRAHNNISHQTVSRSAQLFVFYIPDRHPECMWMPAADESSVQFNCTWFGTYPLPTLSWEDDGAETRGAQSKRRVYASEVTNSLSLALNRSMLSDGQTLTCRAQHPALAAGKEASCSFTLKPPYPEGDPLAAALEASSITLTCTESMSKPPASTTWRKGLQQDAIVYGSKYLLSVNGPVLGLTIVNVSKDDEGVYFCRSENPLGVRELEVYLTVKTSSAYTGAIIGVFIAVLIVGSAVIIARTVYSSRHKICLGGGFGQMDEDRGDVLSLVESDDEQIFQDSVPRLPPVTTTTNGRHTTLVQIHRIPSSDHEDADPTDTSPQQQDDSERTEEPEDLVTF